MGLARQLYRNETRFDLVGARKKWYAASAVILVICIASIAIRHFNFGIEFAGGNSYQVVAKPGVTLAAVRQSVTKIGVEVSSTQFVGAGGQRSILLKTAELTPQKSQQVKNTIAKRLGVRESDVSDSAVSSSWGGDVTKRALIGLVVFLVLVCVLIALRFEFRMAIAAIAALVHDLLLTAGIYSIVGFEVTPSTVVGLLTILGYSLYDTVVVFDKVAENTRGILAGSRTTYSEAANLAVNQTLMRSINTSLIALLPVSGLLFVGAGLLGVGTLKDLALVLFVGLATGAYSSIFLATPILADLKEREPAYAALRQRVLAKRAGAPAATRATVPAGKGPAEAARASSVTTTAVLDHDDAPDPAVPAAPRPGSRPAPRTARPAARKKGGRPSGSKRKRR